MEQAQRKKPGPKPKNGGREDQAGQKTKASPQGQGCYNCKYGFPKVGASWVDCKLLPDWAVKKPQHWCGHWQPED